MESFPPFLEGELSLELLSNMYLNIYTHKPRTSATKICPLLWQRRQKAQRDDMSHSFSITELLPFTLCEQEQGSGEVWKEGDKLCSMWHNSSQEAAKPRPTNTCRCPCCQKEQLPRWTLHPWLLRDKGHLHILHIKAGARELLDTPAAPLTQLGHRNCVETKLVSNSSLGRRLTQLPLNCYMLLEKTTK